MRRSLNVVNVANVNFMKRYASTFKADMVKSSLQGWCDAVVAVGKCKTDGGDTSALATKILSDAYDYDNGTVLFKPTLTHGEQTFRGTKEGAHAYFVGKNPKFPNDGGFLLKPWVKCWFTNEKYFLNGPLAVVQCNMHFTSAAGDQIYVDKSFVFKACDDGKVRLALHHSSLPYKP